MFLHQINNRTGQSHIDVTPIEQWAHILRPDGADTGAGHSYHSFEQHVMLAGRLDPPPYAGEYDGIEYRGYQ